MPKYLDETGLATNIQIAKDTFMEKMTVDSTPTANSTNLVTSGGVKAAIDSNNVWEVGTGTNSVKQKNSGSTASGDNAIATGDQTNATGESSYTEGIGTTASGMGAHAEGSFSQATALAAHSEGQGNLAQNLGEHAEGRYNKSNKANTTFGNAGNTISSIGIGTGNSTRKNAFEIMQNGDTYLYGLGTYNGTNPISGTNDIKTIINSKVSLSNIKKVGFAQDIFYNPAGSYDTYISLFNHDKAQATAQDPKYAVEAISTRTEDNKYFIDITLSNLVRQSYTASNNNYPLAIAGMQYSNMTSGNCLPVYYSPNVQVNPSTGILSVNDVSISGTSAATAISNLTTNKQNKLVSGTNIKTVNNTSLLGSGNVAVQPTLVSGTNIKKINNQSLLGSGNLNITYADLWDRPWWTGTGYNWAVHLGTGSKLPSGEDAEDLDGAVAHGSCCFDSAVVQIEGLNIYAAAPGAHAEGIICSDDDWRAIDAVKQTLSGSGIHALGEGSHAEGAAYIESIDTAPRGIYATGWGAHAEGRTTLGGSSTTASGAGAHAEGEGTTAEGVASHAEGKETIAQNNYEHSQGQFNVSNKASYIWGNAGNTLFNIGIGTSDSTRKNAFEVMQNGDMYLYGIGTYDGTNPTTSVNDIKTIVNSKASKTTLGSSIPSGGMLPNIFYNLGTISSATTMTMAAASDNTIYNEWMFQFTTGSTAPTITWDAAITAWVGGSAPTIEASKTYQVSVVNGLGVIGTF